MHYQLCYACSTEEKENLEVDPEDPEEANDQGIPWIFLVLVFDLL